MKDPRGKRSRQNAENMLCWCGAHHLFENFICFKVWFELGMETHAFNPSTRKLELSLSSRPAESYIGILGQSGIHSKMLSFKKKKWGKEHPGDSMPSSGIGGH